jgi:hypothetical protein
VRQEKIGLTVMAAAWQGGGAGGRVVVQVVVQVAGGLPCAARPRGDPNTKDGQLPATKQSRALARKEAH